MNIENWLEQATEKILFAPDREAVRQELADHLQDRQERYAAKGLGAGEAERAALADMGDPADIAEELGKLHRPWWGYLWTLSKLLLGLAAFVAIIGVFTAWDGLIPQKPTHLWETYSYSGTTLLTRQKLPDRAKVGNYTVSASTILLEDTDGAQYLVISLRFLPHIPWEPVDRDSLYKAALEGSLTDDGYRLYSMENWWLKDMGACRDGPGGVVRYMEFSLRLEGGQIPKWIDIPLGVSDYTLRVDLEEGVSLQ